MDVSYMFGVYTLSQRGRSISKSLLDIVQLLCSPEPSWISLNAIIWTHSYPYEYRQHNIY